MSGNLRAEPWGGSTVAIAVISKVTVVTEAHEKLAYNKASIINVKIR